MAEGKCPDITGMILVGGKSRRMGRDKAFLKVEGIPIAERALTVFRECFAQVVMVGDRKERFTGFDIQVIPDIYPGSALGGVYTGLYHAETEYVFSSSCDLPFPNAELVRYLCSLRNGYDAVVPTTANGYEPLFALYAKSCLGPIQAQLDSGECCAYAYYPQIRVRYVADDELARFDPDGRAFLNINTPEDFAKIGGEL